VFDFLEEQGVVQARMDWFGYGLTRPVAPNIDREGRARNRRVDLVIGEQ
jgi:outer membrane protein OmpA-like peptidoglycan-associated protein